MTLGALGSAVFLFGSYTILLLWLMVNARAVARVALLEASLATERIRHAFIETTFAPAKVFLFLLFLDGIGWPALIALFPRKHLCIGFIPGRAGGKQHNNGKEDSEYGKKVSHPVFLQS